MAARAARLVGPLLHTPRCQHGLPNRLLQLRHTSSTFHTTTSLSAAERVFQQYAVEKKDHLTFTDFYNMLEETGLELEVTEESARQLFNHIDCDSNGAIDPKEFSAWWPSVSHKYLDAPSPMAAYDVLVSQEEVENDECQRKALVHLQRVWKDLVKFQNRRDRQAKAAAKKGFLSSLFSSSDPAKLSITSVRGAYLWGGVGCGKSFLMDLFYEKARIKKKKRVHFHAFMLDIHARIHRIKKQDVKKDEIAEVVREISEEVELLCFDEFQVTDVGDAMILRRLFSKLFEKGLVVVATSNRHPNDLYEGGINREVFVPFIQLLRERCVVHDMKSGTDYRKAAEKLDKETVYFTPLNTASEKKFMELLDRLTEGKPLQPTTISVLGREVPVQASKNGVCLCSFHELCSRPLGAADYGALAKKFHTVFLSDIPKLSLDQRTEARRFIILVDELYEKKCKVFATAAAAPDALFASGKGMQDIATGDLSSIDLELSDALKISDVGSRSLFTGSDEIFAFGRAVSRLNEMQTKDYLLLPHVSASKSPEPVRKFVESLA